jgi:hypothetical protein
VALEWIGELYGVERDLQGEPSNARPRERPVRSKPLTEALETFAKTCVAQVPGRSDLAKAWRYMLARWPAHMRAFDDGRVARDNNAAERALPSVAFGRKNYLSAGSGLGAERAAAFYTLV